MLEAKVSWVTGFKFTGVDGTGREMKMDASVGSGGEGDGFRPAELPLMGLAGCTGMDTIEILQKMRQPVESFEVRVTAEKQPKGTPPGYAGVRVEYIVRGKGLSREKVERAVKLSEEKYCTVSGAIARETSVTHEITIEETE
ncbi:OsmC family protein [bacterium]|nr:OsmC family protein [bacterium]